jgi:hypothetical protein
VITPHFVASTAILALTEPGPPSFDKGHALLITLHLSFTVWIAAMRLPPLDARFPLLFLLLLIVLWTIGLVLLGVLQTALLGFTRRGVVRKQKTRKRDPK